MAIFLKHPHASLFDGYSFTKGNLDLFSLNSQHSVSLVHSNLALPHIPAMRLSCALTRPME